AGSDRKAPSRRAPTAAGRSSGAAPAAAQARDIGGVGGRAARKGGGAGDEHIGARGDRRRRGLSIDAAIDLEIDRAAERIDEPAQRADLVERAGDEALA